MNEMMLAKRKKKKMKSPEEDMSQYDDMHYWTRPKKVDRHFYGHIKKQVLF